MNSRLHEMEIDSIAWEKFETQNGDASKVRAALIEIINAPANEAEKSYWAIENHVVVQGELLSSAEPTLNVILAALAGGSLQRHTRIDLLELAFQIISAAVQKRDEHPQIYKLLQDRILACAN